MLLLLDYYQDVCPFALNTSVSFCLKPSLFVYKFIFTHQKLDNMIYCLLESFKDWPVESIMKSQVAGYEKCV